MNSNYFNISKLYRTPENSMSSSHTHSFWELFYLTKGSCSILIRDALYEINEGTIFLIPCDISHKTIYSNTDNERIVIELGDDYVAPIISGFPDLTFYNKYCCHFFTFNSNFPHARSSHLRIFSLHPHRCWRCRSQSLAACQALPVPALKHYD